MRRLVFSCVCVAMTIAAMTSCSDQENPAFATPPPDEDAGADGGPGDGPDVITGDPSKGILLQGTVIGENGPFDGMVLVGTDGNIACAAPGDACANDPKADGVARFDTKGIIAPGLIDTHNHILFDIFDNSDWFPAKVYTNHDQWPKEANYAEMIDIKQCVVDDSQGKPTWCPAHFDGAGSLRCEVLKFGEMKALVAGTTSVTGLAGTSLPCFGSLARSIDTQFNGFDSDLVQTAAILPSQSTADGVCKNFASGKTAAYLVHVGEGTDQTALGEWAKLGSLTTTPGCLYAPQTAITHGTSFGANEFAQMKAKGMKLTWSPASNMALYGATTNIPLALDNGILVSLAPDWSMGGSANMLDEMRFALKVSKDQWNGRLTTKDLFEMSTKNAAIVLGLQDRIGTIKVGAAADLFAVKKSADDPYDSIVAATPAQVRFTMVGGKIIFGDESLRAVAAFGDACEKIDACGAPKFICVAVPGAQNDKLNETWDQIKQLLDAALTEMDDARVTVGGKTDGLKFSPLTPLVSCPK